VILSTVLLTVAFAERLGCVLPGRPFETGKRHLGKIMDLMIVELTQITPPVGFKLFVVQNLSGKDIFTVARYAPPFFLLMFVAVALIAVFPEIVLSLPQAMTAR
jgi:TRAP-type C4-dicarboxylate transport system permease large subunit